MVFGHEGNDTFFWEKGDFAQDSSSTVKIMDFHLGNDHLHYAGLSDILADDKWDNELSNMLEALIGKKLVLTYQDDAEPVLTVVVDRGEGVTQTVEIHMGGEENRKVLDDVAKHHGDIATCPSAQAALLAQMIVLHTS